MNPDLLVGVWVLGDGWEKEEFATGYPVAPDRILTVGHIFKAGWNKILVQAVFVPQSAASSASVSWPRPNMVWTETDTNGLGLDAVLLEWEFPTDRASHVNFMRDRPQADVAWFSNCFAQFARGGGPPGEYLDARGRFNPSPDGPTFPIECDEKRQQPQDWGGASGGPIFVGAQLAGIVKGVSLGKSSRLSNGQIVAPLERLEAVPAWKLFAAAGFMESLGGDTTGEFQRFDGNWQKNLARRLKAELGSIRNPKFTELLELEFSPPITLDDDFLKNLSEELASDPKLVGRLTKIRRQCREKNLVDEAEQIELIEDHLLPRTISLEARHRFWNELQNDNVILIEHAASCPAGADGRFAVPDQRKVDFPREACPEDVTQWCGRPMHPFPKLKPGNLSPECVAYRILFELASSRLGPDQSPFTLDTLEEILSGQTTLDVLPEGKEKAERYARTLNRTLETRKSAYGSTQYCLVRVDETGLKREELREVVKFLRAWIPELVFAEISKECPTADEEAPMIEILRTRKEDAKQ